MRSTTRLLTVTALAEVAAGLALLVIPSVAIRLVLGVGQPSPDALVIGRLGGAGLLAIGVACWIAHHDAGGTSQRGLVCAALIYNVGAVAVLAYAGSRLAMAGALLWPAVVLHAGLTAWCLVCLAQRSVPSGDA
jgi:hypothetical protein